MKVVKMSSFALLSLLTTTVAVSQDTAAHGGKASPPQPKTIPAPTILACASPSIPAASTTSCEEVFEDGTVCIVTFISSIHLAGTPTEIATTQSCDFSKRK